MDDKLNNKNENQLEEIDKDNDDFESDASIESGEEKGWK